jgi:hypothetical protein
LYDKMGNPSARGSFHATLKVVPDRETKVSPVTASGVSDVRIETDVEGVPVPATVTPETRTRYELAESKPVTVAAVWVPGTEVPVHVAPSRLVSMRYESTVRLSDSTGVSAFHEREIEVSVRAVNVTPLTADGATAELAF